MAGRFFGGLFPRTGPGGVDLTVDGIHGTEQAINSMVSALVRTDILRNIEVNFQTGKHPRLFHLPVVVDAALPDDTVEFRDHAGHVLARLYIGGEPPRACVAELEVPPRKADAGA